MLARLDGYFPPKERVGRYFEPFLGGGAVFFYLRPERAYISDANYELVNAYRVIKEHVDELIQKLETLQGKRLSRSLYDRYRRMKPQSLDPIEAAARFIFLNKTCFNGLYRVNKNGDFNVPFGKYRKMPKLFDEDNLRAAKALLEKAEVDLADYEIALRRATKGDFVYLDPPYLSDSQTNGFTNYTKESFSSADEEDLHKVFRDLDRRGCLIMLSESATKAVKSLFSEFKETTFTLSADRMINCVGSKRTGFTELLILNYEPEFQTITKWVRE